MSNSTQNDEIKQIEKAIDEGFAESEKFLKGMKTPFDKPTQNDWEAKWDRLEKFIYYQNMFDGSDGKRDCVDFFMAKKLVRELLADARKEVIASEFKECTCCRRIKNVTEYFKKGDTIEHTCKKCSYANKKAYNKRMQDRINELARGRWKEWLKKPGSKEIMLERIRRYNEKYPEKYKARNMLRNAVKAGKIVKSTSCTVCNLPKQRIEGHHHDYSKPFDVTWACPKCHRFLDRELKRLSTLREEGK